MKHSPVDTDEELYFSSSPKAPRELGPEEPKQRNVSNTKSKQLMPRDFK